MFSAHIIMGDLNNHSELDFSERNKKLNLFWKICEEMKPKNIKQGNDSFYKTSNDSLFAGFSNLYEDNLAKGENVLKWVIRLHSELKKNNVEASFGVNLLALKRNIIWESYSGFLNRIDMIHIDDHIHKSNNGVSTDRLVGDSLIITARLQSLAKKLGVPIVFSVHQGGLLDKGINEIKEDGLSFDALIESAEDKFSELEEKHASWLKERNIKAWSIKL